jgi:DNA polymerase-3 subunit delta
MEVLEAAKASQGALCVFHAPALDAKSELRKWAEKSKTAASHRFDYPERDEIENILGLRLGKVLDGTVIAAIAERVGRDSLLIEQEIAKIEAYCADGGDHAQIVDLVAADGSHDIDRLLSHVLKGQVQQAMEEWQRLRAREESHILVIRSLSWRLLRMHQLKRQMEEGRSFDDAAKSLKPPIFFTQKVETRNLVERLSGAQIMGLVGKVSHSEILTKKTNCPGDVITRHTLIETATTIRRGGRG